MSPSNETPPKEGSTLWAPSRVSSAAVMLSIPLAAVAKNFGIIDSYVKRGILFHLKIFHEPEDIDDHCRGAARRARGPCRRRTAGRVCASPHGFAARLRCRHPDGCGVSGSSARGPAVDRGGAS